MSLIHVAYRARLQIGYGDRYKTLCDLSWVFTVTTRLTDESPTCLVCLVYQGRVPGARFLVALEPEPT